MKFFFGCCLLFFAFSVKAVEKEGPPTSSWDLPVWRAVIDQAARFEGRDYYKLLDERGAEHKALRSTRGAIMALIETSDFYDPDPDATISERAEEYDYRWEDLGKPSEATLRLVQQLTLENLAAEIEVARVLGEKKYFADRSYNESYGDWDHPRPANRFKKEDADELHKRCKSIARLALFLEQLPGGDNYPQGIERSNATLLLYYVVQGQRAKDLGEGWRDLDFASKGVAYCDDELKEWPKLSDHYLHRNTDPALNVWNFQLPSLLNKLDGAAYEQVIEEHHFPLPHRSRKKGFGDEADRYQALTLCGRIELEGARTQRFRETHWTYPFFDSHYRWIGPIAETCRSPAGGHNYSNVHEVLKAWAARVNAP